MNIYFIPGLGSDKRIFRNIRVPEGCEPVYLDWVKPLKKETLENYSCRLADKIDTSVPYIIVGLSFGGMLAAEIINRFPNGKMILISSVPSSVYLPSYYRFAGKLKLHRLLPVWLFKSASLMKRIFTAETPEQKAYLKKAIHDLDPSFVRWAINAIVEWKGNFVNASYIHIHGTNDLILPAKFCSPTHPIKGGGHLLIMTKSKEINKILEDYCNELIRIAN